MTVSSRWLELGSWLLLLHVTCGACFQSVTMPVKRPMNLRKPITRNIALMAWGKSSREEFEQRDRVTSAFGPMMCDSSEFRQIWSVANIGKAAFGAAGATVGVVGGAVAVVGSAADVFVGVAGAAAGAVAPPGSRRRDVALRAGTACGDAAGATAGIVSGVAGAANAVTEFNMEMVFKLERKYSLLFDGVFQKVYDEAFEEAYADFSTRCTGISITKVEAENQCSRQQEQSDLIKLSACKTESNSQEADNQDEQEAPLPKRNYADVSKRQEMQRRMQRKRQKMAITLDREQVLEIFALRPNPSVTVWKSSSLRFDSSAECLCAELAVQYDVKKKVIKEIWGRKSRISTTRPHWTDHELKEDVLSRKFGQALKNIVKSTPTHQKSVHLNLWAQKYLEFEAKMEEELALESSIDEPPMDEEATVNNLMWGGRQREDIINGLDELFHKECD